MNCNASLNDRVAVGLRLYRIRRRQTPLRAPRRYDGAVTTFLFAAVALLAAPAASQPASGPAAPKADERVVRNENLRFQFAVPKLWKSVPQQANAAIYVFQVPATGESRRIAPSLIITARDAAEMTLEDEVKGRREAILQRNAGITFDEDAATVVAGHAGWTFAYATKLNQTVTSGNEKHVEQVAIKVIDRLAIIDGRAFEFVLTTDDKGMVIRRRLFDRVISTLAVDPAAAR